MSKTHLFVGKKVTLENGLKAQLYYLSSPIVNDVASACMKTKSFAGGTYEIKKREIYPHAVVKITVEKETIYLVYVARKHWQFKKLVPLLETNLFIAYAGIACFVYHGVAYSFPHSIGQLLFAAIEQKINPNLLVLLRSPAETD